MKNVEDSLVHTQEEEKVEQGIDTKGMNCEDVEGMKNGPKVDAKFIEQIWSNIKLWQSKIDEAERELALWQSALKSAQAQLALQPDPPRTLAARVIRGARTDYVRRLVHDSGEAGISPAEIRQRAAIDKVSLKSNFPYTILAKLKHNDGSIRESGGRYYKSR